MQLHALEHVLNEIGCQQLLPADGLADPSRDAHEGNRAVADAGVAEQRLQVTFELLLQQAAVQPAA